MSRPSSPSGASQSIVRPASSGVFDGLIADLKIRPDEFLLDLRVSPPPELGLLLAWPLFAWALATIHELTVLDGSLTFLILPALALVSRLSDRWTQAMVLVSLGLPGPLLHLI